MYMQVHSWFIYSYTLYLVRTCHTLMHWIRVCGWLHECPVEVARCQPWDTSMSDWYSQAVLASDTGIRGEAPPLAHLTLERDPLLPHLTLSPCTVCTAEVRGDLTTGPAHHMYSSYIYGKCLVCTQPGMG